jgi:uncharacterized protein (DUF885 family)
MIHDRIGEMMRRILAPLMLTAALHGHCASAQSPNGTATRLEGIYEAQWQRWLREDPTLATAVGDSRYNDRWPDLSFAAIQNNNAADLAALATLSAIDASTLAAPDRLNLEVIKLQFARRVALAAFNPSVYWISQLGSVQTPNSLQTAEEIAEITPFSTVLDYDNWIARLRGFAQYLDQGTQWLKLGIREKRTQPCVIMLRVKEQIAAQRVGDPAQSPFFTPFMNMPASITQAERDRLIASGRDAISASVLPAFARFDQFFTKSYLPACRNTVGISATPNGQAYYRALIAYHTTTALSSDEIHQIGLQEVQRIHREMDAIIARVGYQGSFQQFAHFLRTDPQFFYTDPNDLLHGYMVIAKSIDPNLTKLFGQLPRTPYGVRPIPSTSAPNSTTAYYQPLAADGSRAGYYYVNLYKPEARPKWEMEVLTAHEAIPGHHLQTALQYEHAAGVPMIRRMADFTAYVEGWGLYAESLGGDLGLYSDPYQKFGELTYDMWRAVRLVVDTGMHAKGWSREQAIEYFMANAPKSELDITNEIDRYIAWPGQALAYKIGQLKFLELRDTSKQALGAAFDIREFHDVVLATGAVPLSVLQHQVEDWLVSKRPPAP